MIQTERLQLVKFDMQYAADLYELWSDYEVIKYTYMPLLHSIEECESKIKMFLDYTDEKFINNFIICLNNKAIGIIGSPIIDIEKKKFGLFYQLSRAYWGKGYIGEASNAFVQYLICEFPDAKIIADAVTDNPASMAILERLGLKQIHIEKDGFKCNDIEMDLAKYTNNFQMTHCGTQTIETDRLILRKFTLEDSSAMYQNWASDPEVTKYLMWPTHENQEISEMVTKEWVDSYSKSDFYQWAIIVKEESDKPIGSISVVDKDEKISMVHIGYCIGREWWHRGITSEALEAVINFMFEKVGINRIESRHDPRNPNSGAVMKKCGMIYEGTHRSADWNNQGICDACYYSILRKDTGRLL